MATVDERREAMQQLIVTVNMMATNLGAATPPVVVAPAGHPQPIVVLNVAQRINQSSSKLVQLSRQDSQYTDKEKGETALFRAVNLT